MLSRDDRHRLIVSQIFRQNSLFGPLALSVTKMNVRVVIRSWYDCRSVGQVGRNTPVVFRASIGRESRSPAGPTLRPDFHTLVWRCERILRLRRSSRRINHD